MYSKIDKISAALLSLTLLSLCLFFYCLYFPSKAQATALQNQIQLAKLSIEEFPVKVQNQIRLQNEIDAREKYLSENRDCIPAENNLHSILEQVTVLAKRSRIEIIRLEPRKMIKHQSYLEIPFQFDLAGSTQMIQQFLFELERQQRLFKIEKISLSGKSNRSDQNIIGEMNISIYTFYEDSIDNSDNNSSQQSRLPI